MTSAASAMAEKKTFGQALASLGQIMRRGMTTKFERKLGKQFHSNPESALAAEGGR